MTSKTQSFSEIILYRYSSRKGPFFVATDGVRILQGINGMEGNYLLSLLARNRPKSEGYKRYYSILADREIFFTDNSDEQTQIGSYFRQLDNIITLHQREKCIKQILGGLYMAFNDESVFEDHLLKFSAENGWKKK